MGSTGRFIFNVTSPVDTYTIYGLGHLGKLGVRGVETYAGLNGFTLLVRTSVLTLTYVLVCGLGLVELIFFLRGLSYFVKDGLRFFGHGALFGGLFRLYLSFYGVLKTRQDFHIGVVVGTVLGDETSYRLGLKVGPFGHLHRGIKHDIIGHSFTFFVVGNRSFGYHVV